MDFAAGTVLIQTGGDFGAAVLRPGWLHFASPKHIIDVRAPHDGSPGLDILRDAIATLRQYLSQGYWAAGFFAYEAAPTFDPALVVCTLSPGAPLLWFGIYEAPHFHDALPGAEEPLRPSDSLEWTPLVSAEDYAARHEQVRAYIAAGDTYQVNLTYALRASFQGDPYNLFRSLHAAQRPRYGAYIQANDFAVASVSPELFFAQAEGRVLTRPMKGTMPRGRWLAEDRARAEALRASAKERAENLMIVDLLRNDLGRVAKPGSVAVEALHEVERYPTLWQMTSTIAAQTAAEPLDVLAALFPCGSVTGAPKVRTMQIIRELEAAPRGIYCGAIGFIGPGNLAQFNVAIRTVCCDLARGEARYGVGGGVTWDSRPEKEHLESRVKARVLDYLNIDPDFQLIETLLWEPAGGFFLLDEHLRRLRDSAEYFDFNFDSGAVLQKIEHALHSHVANQAESRRVRFLLSRTGGFEIASSPLEPPFGAPDPEAAHKLTSLRVALASAPVDPEDVFLFHKTTRREVYDQALRTAQSENPSIDDILLFNRDGDLTESTRANLVLDIGGNLLTPSRECGLLDGVMRRHLLNQGVIQEKRLTLENLHAARAGWLINSVRRWLRFEIDLQ